MDKIGESFERRMGMDSKYSPGSYRSETEQDMAKVPKNIRQIGTINNHNRMLYIEDYVISYTKQLVKREKIGCTIVVLLGVHNDKEGIKNIFIKGAIEMECFDSTRGILMSEEGWASVFNNLKRYFNDVGIVGWAVIGSEFYINNNEILKKIHQDNFSGQDKILMKVNSIENEENFYIYEQGSFVRQEGYFVYYEKNDEMQNYMVDVLKPKSSEIASTDETTEKMRTVISDMKSPKLKEKKGKERNTVFTPTAPKVEHTRRSFIDTIQKEKEGSLRGTSKLVYVAATLLLIVVLILGDTIMDNNKKIADLQKSVETMQEISHTTNSLDKTDKVVGGDDLEQEAKEPSNKEESQVLQPDQVEEVFAEEKKDILEVETISSGIQSETNPPNIVNDIIAEKIIEPTIEPTPVPTEVPTQAPTAVPKVTKAPEPTKAASAEVKYYVVKEGESLAGIAYKLYNSANYINIIKELNGIDNEDKIIIGQKLIIP